MMMTGGLVFGFVKLCRFLGERYQNQSDFGEDV